ncbi:MAG: alpha-galactosidase [Clostridia bacterium]|nr:alpha-galactosidase [Clostridia bacterium]
MKHLICGAQLLDIQEELQESENIICLPNGHTDKLIQLLGNHWRIRSVLLHAFSDNSDTLIEERERMLFAGGSKKPIEGNLFFLDNIESGESLMLSSEAPDFVTTLLYVKHGELWIENLGNAIAIGYGKTDEIEAICRTYYKRAMINKLPRTMSNTWGDRHGADRVCRDFVLREIQAAREIGVDIVQIDDGWQTGHTYDKANLNEQGRRIFRGDFWEFDPERFPGGMTEITAAVHEGGLKLGLWFAPDSENNYAYLERDLSVLKKAYAEWGVRFFKLDMYWIESNENKEQFLKLLKTIYSFGDDVAVQLDVTRDQRINYLCGKEYGSIFVENRYTKSANAYPYRVLRNLWSFSKYLPTTRFQFELVNPDLYRESYPENDPFAPSHYGMDYLFASVMLSNPLFWMELQFLSEERRAELAPIMKVWRRLREEIATADIQPIGERPDGRSLTGFAVRGKENSYLLLFRELTDRDTLDLKFTKAVEIQKTLISNTDVTATAQGDRISVTLSKPCSYALIEINMGTNEKTSL